MIYNYENYENNLKVRNFSRQNQRDYSLLLESPAGMKSKIASLSDNNLSDYYQMKDICIDFIVGMSDDFEKYVFQLTCYNSKTGVTKIYGREFPLEEDKEYIAAAQSEELFEDMIKKFKNLLKQEEGGYLLDRLGKLVTTYNLDFLGSY